MTPDPGAIVYRQGTHRIRDPQETLDAIAPFLARAGVTRTANLTGLDRIGLPIAMCVRPNARSISVSHGKGVTLAAARASAQMEALETYVAEMAPAGTARGTLAKPPGDAPLVDVTRLPCGTEGRAPVDADIGFVRGRNLMTGVALWAPEEIVNLDYTLPMPTGHGWLHASSNGLASGNSFDEAAVHALCEVIERASTSHWMADGRARMASRIDPDSVTGPGIADLVARLRAAGIQVWLWDQTCHLGVAAFMCSIAETGPHPLSTHLHTGYGCHPDRDVALSRALTEAAQMRMTYLAGARDDQDHAYFGPSAFQRRPSSRFGKDVREVPDFAADSHGAELAHLLDRLRAAGLDTVYAHEFPLGESLGDAPISVVRVVVPGLPGPPDALNGHVLTGTRA